MLLLALLVALAAAPAHAASTGCLEAKPAPRTLDELRACHKKTRAAAVLSAKLKGAPLDADALEALDETRRAETRRFLADSGSPAGRAPPGKLGGATPQDLSRVDPKSAAALSSLQTRLHSAAGDGAQGITPAMAADIRATLMQAQGGVSPDMSALLDALAHDGGNLTPGTMQLLQGAGRAVKDEGLNLNIDPKLEQELLHHDFNSDGARGRPQSPPNSL